MKILTLALSLVLFVIGAEAQSQTVAEYAPVQKFSLSQRLARHIGELAEQEAVKTKLNVSIAVVDEAGQLIYFTKMDDSHNASIEISIAKARSAALFKRDTRVLKEGLDKGNYGILRLPNAIATEGGVVLVYQGKPIGAIGISGATSEEDGKIAQAGASFLSGLK